MEAAVLNCPSIARRAGCAAQLIFDDRLEPIANKSLCFSFGSLQVICVKSWSRVQSKGDNSGIEKGLQG